MLKKLLSSTTPSPALAPAGSTGPRDGFSIMQEGLERILSTRKIKGIVSRHYIGEKQAILYVDCDSPVGPALTIEIEQELRANRECDKRLMYLFWRFSEQAMLADTGQHSGGG